MKILILTQLYPMGNYLLNQKVAKHFEDKGHEVLLLPQLYLSGKGFGKYFMDIKTFNPDVCYYEMLDQDTLNVVSMLDCEKVLVLASLGIFSSYGLTEAVNKIQELKGNYYTKIYTNSLLLYKLFKASVPTQFFKYYFSSLEEEDKIVDERYTHDTVFLGMGYQRTEKQSAEKEIFFDNLKDSKQFSIYGAGWSKEQYPCYKGLLPPNDIAKLYTSSKRGIAMIQEQQAKLGMINNRYIEMMSCGLPIYSLRYDEVTFHEGAEFIMFVNDKKQMNSMIDISYGIIDCKRKAKEFADKMSIEYFEKLDHLMGV